MNLDLLAVAGRQTGDDRYLHVAVEHARTAQRVFPRPDGSTPHVFDFDPGTGAPIGPGTVQGTPVLWTRDDNSGTVYSYPLTVDQATGLPPLLHAPTRTPLVSGVTTTTGGKLCLASPSAKTADGTVLVVANCDGGAGQQLTLRADGTVRVLGKCLSTQGAAVAQSTPVVIDTCDGSAIQQ
jgi:hypothetical protein